MAIESSRQVYHEFGFWISYLLSIGISLPVSNTVLPGDVFALRDHLVVMGELVGGVARVLVVSVVELSE